MRPSTQVRMPDRYSPNDGYRFDEKAFVAVQSEVSELDGEIETVSEQLMNEYETDKWEGDETRKLVQYQKMQLKHAQLMRERDWAVRVRDAMDDFRPRLEAEVLWPNDSLRRFCLGGRKNLDTTEQKTFMMDPTQEEISQLPAIAQQSDFECFYTAGHLPKPKSLPELVDADGNPLTGRDAAVATRPLVYRPVPRGIRLAAGDPTRSDIDTGDSAAGLAAVETWAPGLVEALAYYGSVASSCWNFSTDNGNDRHVNQMDTADQEGGAVTDQSQAATGKPGDPQQLANVTDIVFKSYWRHSQFMDERLEAFTDLHFDAASRIERESMRRQGRGWNRWFTTGDGTNKPEGIVTTAMVVDGEAGSADDGSGGIDYDNLLDLEYAIDLAYLMGDEGGEGAFSDENGGMIGWMLNRNIERSLRRAKDGDNRPLWSPDLETGRAIQGRPGRINGYPYSINQHMATGKAANDLPIMFGSCGHYGVRNIGGQMFFRFFDSNTVTSMSVRFIGMSRRDARTIGPLDASNKCEALAVLQVKG